MMPVLVDSNVLLDVTSGNERWGLWSTASLQHLADEAILVINPVVYGEVSVRYTSMEEVDQALPLDHFRRDNIPYAAAFLAGKVFLEYRRRGGLRRAPLPDFYIGAHAAVAGFRLLTRDARRYRTYFPRLELIAP
jgi:predicted nucleic acid-binding protein